MNNKSDKKHKPKHKKKTPSSLKRKRKLKMEAHFHSQVYFQERKKKLQVMNTNYSIYDHHPAPIQTTQHLALQTTRNNHHPNSQILNQMRLHLDLIH